MGEMSESYAERSARDAEGLPCPPHILRPELRGETFWSVCTKCGEEREGGTLDDVLMANLAYIFRDL